MANSELEVHTFRSHHNAYKEGDGSGATVVKYSEQNGILYKLTQHLYGAILMHYFLWFIPMTIVLIIPVYFGYWYISLIMFGYYAKTYYNNDELKGGRPWNWMRQHWLWNLLQNYVKLEIVREAKLDPERQYIFGYHPHGIIILSRTTTYGKVFERLFPGIEQRTLAATPMFNLPGSREICLWMGAVRADKSNAVRILQKHKHTLLLYPGGSAEIFETDSESRDTVIVARKGFIKLALQHGCDLVPTFVFGEKHAYHKLDIPSRVKSFMMETLRTPLIIFWGRFFTWLPLSCDKFFLSVVFGKPIRVEEAVAEPTDEQVDQLYNKFYSEITRLYENYKGKYGYGDDERLIIREDKAYVKKDKAIKNGHANGSSHSNGNKNGKTNGVN